MIGRIVFAWVAWRLRRRMRNAVPMLAVLEAEERELRRRHRPVRQIKTLRQRLVTEQLMRETGRG